MLESLAVGLILKGLCMIFVNKNRYQLANIFKFSVEFLSNRCMAYNFFSRPVAFHVFRLGTTYLHLWEKV